MSPRVAMRRLSRSAKHAYDCAKPLAPCAVRAGYWMRTMTADCAAPGCCAARPLSQIALHLLAETRVDPAHADQQGAEHDEAHDARQRVEIAQVPQEELADTTDQHGEAGEAQDAIAQRESR